MSDVSSAAFSHAERIRHFDDPLYGRIADLIYREAGIVLGPEKKNMMQARLAKRIAATGCQGLAEYVAGIDGDHLLDERHHLVSALTTNFTHFFREAHHFDFLREVVFRDPACRVRQVRLWSAGCSSGQEPYSIVLTAQRAGVRAAVTATDIDQAILLRARRGCYQDAEVSVLPIDLRRQAFSRVGDEWEIRRQFREMVTFQPLNLHGHWPFENTFDAIFCRNVIIYFDAEAQRRLWDRFCQQLRPGGWLFIGHSERIPDHMRSRLRPVRHTIYQYFPD